MRRVLLAATLGCAAVLGPPLPMPAHPPDAEVIPLIHAKAPDFALLALALAEPRPPGPPPGCCAFMLPGQVWPAHHDPVLHIASDARTNSLVVWGDPRARADVREMVERFESKMREPREHTRTCDD